MEIQTDWLHASVLGLAWGAEGWKVSLLLLWSNCSAPQGWKSALEKGKRMYFFFSPIQFCPEVVLKQIVPQRLG